MSIDKDEMANGDASGILSIYIHRNDMPFSSFNCLLGAGALFGELLVFGYGILLLWSYGRQLW